MLLYYGFTIYTNERMLNTPKLRIDDMLFGMEVVSKVKLGYCGPFQLKKSSLVSSPKIDSQRRYRTPPELEIERASCSEINTT